MKRFTYAILFFMPLVAQTAFAQNTISDFHQKTTTPPDARYEIIQSELAAKWTFKLDRFSGTVYQLFKTDDDRNTWEKIPSENFPKIANPSKPRFALFTSGIAARHTFLIDSQDLEDTKYCNKLSL